MPELPEVTTTTRKLQTVLPNQKILGVWTNYESKHYIGKENIKDPKYFNEFKKEILNRKIKNIQRLGKNILINIEGSKTILVHMKMTGHLLYGDYKKVKQNGEEKWVAVEPGPQQDKFNQYIRLVFSLSNNKKLVLSDVRKFAKIMLIEGGDFKNFKDLKKLGPDPLSSNFNLEAFKNQIFKKQNGRIKNVLMNQEIIAGIGNIYSDEALWLSSVHPETQVKQIKNAELKSLLKNIKKVLRKGIDLGGDSTSDYRHPDGKPGNFNHQHNAYRREGEKCLKKDCSGTILRKMVGGRSAHFCSIHQKK